MPNLSELFVFGNQLYKIEEILPNGDLILKDSRYQGGIEEDV